MSSEDVQTNLRLPAELKERLVSVAAANKRSLSAEVTARLEQSLQEPSAVMIWPDLEALTQQMRESTQVVLQAAKETQDLARKIEASKVKKQ